MERTSDQETQDLILKLQNLQNNIPENEKLRRELYSTIQNLSYVLESPIETVKRISYLVIYIPKKSILLVMRISLTIKQ